jgi:hypothetical protein
MPTSGRCFDLRQRYNRSAFRDRGTSEMEQERRANMRKPFGQEVVINHEKGLRFCKLKNISVGGAFLDIGWGALTRNVPVELSVKIPTQEESLKLRAQVARVTTEGTAVSFASLDRESWQAITRFIAA